MPARSRAQQRFMGAELARKRAGKRTLTHMTEKQLEEMASTMHKGLPERVPNKKSPAKSRSAGGTSKSKSRRRS